MVRGASSVQVAPLTRRFVASLIDLAPPVLLVLLAVVVPAGSVSTRSLLIGVAAGIGLAWLVYLWGRYALTGAGPGYRTMDLSLRDVDNGEAIGWWRFFLRQVVLVGMSITVIGAGVLLATILINPRGRGWHDRIAGSIAVYRPREDRAEATAPAWQATDEDDAQRWAPQPPAPMSPSPVQTGEADDEAAPAAHGRVNPHPKTDEAPDHQQLHTAVPRPLSPLAPPVPVPPPRGAVLTPPPDAYLPPPSSDGDPLSAETPILPESAREEALEAARQRGWFSTPDESDGHGVPDSADSTRISVEQAGDYGWYLVLDDGRQVDVSRPLVIGRNPIPPAEQPNALAVRVGETGQAVSKTHLSVSVDGSGLFVVDLGSTNGTAIVGTTGALEPCKAQREVRVRDGQVVSFGDHAFTVRRRPRQ